MRKLTASDRKALQRYERLSAVSHRHQIRHVARIETNQLLDAIMNAMPADLTDQDRAVFAALLRRKAANVEAQRGLEALARMSKTLRARALAGVRQALRL